MFAQIDDDQMKFKQS